MKVNGCECSIVIKTTHHEIDVPYSDETIKEAVSVLQEEASIEGEGNCKAIVKRNGVTGCVVTPITINNAPLLLYLIMGSAGFPVFVSETRNVYKYQLSLLPMQDTDCFDLIQDRSIKNEQLTVNNERRLYEGCRVKGFELRFEREQAIKLKIDITSECPAVVYPNIETKSQTSEMSGTLIGRERFNSNYVDYRINGKKYENIYGLTISCQKENGTKTEIWIKRNLDNTSVIPANIEELSITANLLKDRYEERHYGTFCITLKRLVLTSDETNVNSTDVVIGSLRFYVSGGVSTEVFTSSEEVLQ